MANSRNSRHLLLIAAAGVMLAALIFLFAKTQSAEYKNDAQALALLRELRDLDLRLDADGARLAADLGSRAAPAADRSVVIARVFQELEHGSARSAVGSQVPALRAGMAEKQAAFRALQNAHAHSIEALRTLRESLGKLVAEATQAKSRDPRSAERMAAVLGLVEQARASLRGGDIESLAETENVLEPRIAALVPAAFSASPQLGPFVKTAEAAAGEFLAARAAEGEAWRKFSFLSVGSKIDLGARNLSKSIEGALDDKERWRAYLFAYAAALLLGVGYLGTRVVATQAQLRDANLGLEKRVAERTRDLELTLARLKESEAQLVQSEKMSSLGQLVAGVAHEINTPLAYVKNGVASVRDRIPELRETLAQTQALLVLLQSETADAAALQEAFATLSARLALLAEHQVLQDLETLTRDGLHGIEQISELVANLRNFSRLDRSKVASFNVNEGVRATLLIAKPALRKIDVEKNLAEIPSITCSPSQVNQVLLNLVTNAAQAIDKPRGRIVLTTRHQGMDFIAIEVSDNGKGIAAEALPRIFDPFYTTKEVGKGTGLGLSIAYKIVAEHGGRIDVRSSVGAGSTFTVTLPVRQAPDFTATEPSPEEALA
jgi:two-component system, NtrC family, sensor kinase